MLKHVEMVNFEIVMANGKVGRFDHGNLLDEFYQRNKVVSGVPKKKKKKKEPEEIVAGTDKELDQEYKQKLKKHKPRPKYSTLVRKKPGNATLLNKLKLI